MRVNLRTYFSDPMLNVMNFLSEVTRDYPDAISFATGSPIETFFNVGNTVSAIEDFVECRSESAGISRSVARDDLGQYNRTNGIINELIASHLVIDENIGVRPEAIMLTSGSQEAMAVVMLGLFDPATDVLLVSDPSYIGITGLARILGVPVVPVPVGDAGLEIDELKAAIAAVRRVGKRPRAIYDVPDFNNPLGTVLPLATRHTFLQVARAEELLIIEDNPYGMFAYDGERLPTLKALDTDDVVLYLGTFSKTLFPGLRVGFLVADQQAEDGPRLLAEELSKVKSLTTVNTSALLQAMVGGTLLRTGGSLAPMVSARLPFYRANRDRMVARLAAEFENTDLQGLVRWNRPPGGFFLTVTLPFVFDERCFITCASTYGVLCCPMSFFSLSGTRGNQLRLSFSYVTPEEIDEGVHRLARFVRQQLAKS